MRRSSLEDTSGTYSLGSAGCVGHHSTRVHGGGEFGANEARGGGANEARGGGGGVGALTRHAGGGVGALTRRTGGGVGTHATRSPHTSPCIHKAVHIQARAYTRRCTQKAACSHRRSLVI